MSSPPLWPLKIPPIPQNLPDYQLQLSGWGLHLAAQFTRCVTMGKALDYSEPQSAHLQLKGSIKGCLRENKIPRQ